LKTFLGKIHLKWCTHCNLPILDRICNICKRETNNVKITPPGDARPAFIKDIEMINNILKDQFNIQREDIFKNKIVLISNTPGIDCMKEIILDGTVFGILKYDIKKNIWSILPTVEGARKIVNSGGNKKIIGVKKEIMPYILEKHASVLRPGVVYTSKDIKKGDDVIVLIMDNEEESTEYNENFEGLKDINVLGVGRARMDYQEIINKDKGMVVKIRHAETPKKATYLGETGNLKESIGKMIQANEHVITKYEREAIGFMKNTAEKIKKPIVVAYSGGKDSLAVLLLALKAFRDKGIKFDVIFIDTGLELPETLENVKQVENEYNLEMIKVKSDDFWKKLEEYGPPGRDYRWCSEVCKMKPIEKLIKSRYKEGCLTFVGLRKYESVSRSKKLRIWKSKYIEGQIQSAPILNWSAMHLWLYLFKNNPPYNKLYELCFDRVGCYICPAMDLGEIELLKGYYPHLWEKWEEYLIDYGKRNNLDEEWIRGGWRWKYKNKLK